MDKMTPVSDETTLDVEPRRVASRARLHDEDANLGRRIGPYRVERLIARGGMGRVYLATRKDDYEQRVALKLIDRGTENLKLVERFFRERQILAHLQHPGIAQILDGGSTPDGLPYFVMEYVDGERVDRFCDRHELGLRQRLELFQSICQVVQFSHQNLVIHQDLKPGNILVTTNGSPKLLDFGIAELLQGESEHRQGPGDVRALTPNFASPEQFLGAPVTTASDIYSLGVLLYHLVSGQAPYRLEGLDALQMTEWVRNLEVTPPSQVARREARQRIVGDIDAIVLKAMDKTPEQRYASAAQFAEDLKRHLDDLPIEADPGTWRRRARKSIRRNKLALAILLLVFGSAVTTSVFWRQAVHRGHQAELARSQAETSEAKALSSLLQAERVSVFLEDLFKSGDPDAGDLSVHEILDRGRQRLLEQLEDDPQIRTELLTILGTVYNNLSLYQEARELKEEALAHRRAVDPNDSQDLAVAVNNLGRLLYDLDDYPAAEKLFREAVAIWQRLGDGPRTVLGQRNLAGLLAQSGRPEEALQLYRQILENQHRLDVEDLDVAETLYSLAILRRNLRMHSEAASLLHRALKIFEKELGADHSRVAAVLSSLGRVLHAQGLHQEARRHFERALTQRLRLLGEDHVRVANTRKNFAALLLDIGETALAGELLEQSLATLRIKKAPGDWTLAEAESLWGGYLVAIGHYSKAEPVLLAAYQALRTAKGDEDIATVNARSRVLTLYEAWGKDSKAAAAKQLMPTPRPFTAQAR